MSSLWSSSSEEVSYTDAKTTQFGRGRGPPTSHRYHIEPKNCKTVPQQLCSQILKLSQVEQLARLLQRSQTRHERSSHVKPTTQPHRVERLACLLQRSQTWYERSSHVKPTTQPPLRSPLGPPISISYPKELINCKIIPQQSCSQTFKLSSLRTNWLGRGIKVTNKSNASKAIKV